MGRTLFLLAAAHEGKGRAVLANGVAFGWGARLRRLNCPGGYYPDV